MNQKIVAGKVFVLHLIRPERHIADGKVKEIPAVSRFKTCNGDVRLGIQLLGNASRDAVQLHPVQAAFPHALRQHPEEIAHAAAGFQHIARPEAQLFHRRINGTDDKRAGVMRVQGGCTGSFVFFLCQQGFQCAVFAVPRLAALVKGLRQAAPAHIAGQHFLFLR